MFSFAKEQKVFEISGIKIGGQPGLYPTVLIGGLFFKGEPDYKEAKRHVNKMYELNDKLGNPGIPDFFVRKEEYIQDIINFIKDVVPSNLPFSIDVIDPNIKIEILKSLHKEKLLSRTIYNSIHIGITNEEREALKRFKPEAAIVVAFNPKDKSPDGRLEVLSNGANLLDKGLLDISREIGIEKILIDTAAMAPGDGSGSAISSIPVVKEEYGLPTGCAIHNVVEKSVWLNSFKEVKRATDAASNLNIPLFGGDFAIFGPISNSELVFPMIAWQDILISEYTESYFGVKPCDYHPRRKLTR